MKEKVECFAISCDNCHDVYENNSGYSLFADEQATNEELNDDEWLTQGEKHYCPLCYSYNDNDELIINKERFEELKPFEL